MASPIWPMASNNSGKLAIKPVFCTFTTWIPACRRTSLNSGFSSPQAMTMSGPRASIFSTFGVPKPLTRSIPLAAGG